MRVKKCWPGTSEEVTLRSRGADAAGFEAVGFGFGGGWEGDAVLLRDAVDPVAVLQMKNTQHEIPDERVGGRICRGRTYRW